MNPLEPITLQAVSALVFPLCRVGGFFATLTVFSGTGVPVRFRALLSLMFTICVLPAIPAPPEDLTPFSLTGFLVVCKEMLIGCGIGFMTSFLSQIFTLAGQAVAMQTGLGFASMVDPVSGSNAPVVGQFFTILTTLTFLAINGHIIFIELLIMSFKTLPVGLSFLTLDGLSDIAYFGSYLFEGGLSLSISANCTMLVVTFTLGVMTRAAPQLHIFSVGFAVSMIVGLFVLHQVLRAYLVNFMASFNEIMSLTCTLIGTACEDGVF